MKAFLLLALAHPHLEAMDAWRDYLKHQCTASSRRCSSLLALEMADEKLPAAAAALLQAAGADATELQVQGDQKHGTGAAGRPAGLRSPSDDEQGHGDGKDPALHLQHHGPKQLLQHRHHRQLLLLVLVTCM